MDLQKNEPEGISLEIKGYTADNMITIAKWMKFLAIVGIVLGGLYCLTCVGAVVGWFPILVGVWMLKCANSFIEFVNHKMVNSFDEAINKLKYIYVASGIAMIIYLAFLVFYIIFLIFYSIALASAGSEMFEGLFDMFNNYR